MSEQYTVMIDTCGSEDEEDARCMTVKDNGQNIVAIQILGPDQSATEFLTREMFEDLVKNTRRLMGWGREG